MAVACPPERIFTLRCKGRRPRVNVYEMKGRGQLSKAKTSFDRKEKLQANYEQETRKNDF